MKIIKNGDVAVVMDNPNSKFNYFGWPSAAKLQNGKIAVTASGYRLSHIDPFGKAVICYSDDEGETYTTAAPCIDTPLDDRDAGICVFGEKSVIVTSFNNSVAFQRKFNEEKEADKEKNERSWADPRMVDGYLGIVTEDEEKKYLGSEFVISNDYGVTFGEIFKSPVTSPHGPTQLSDGTLLWVGRKFSPDDTYGDTGADIAAYKINTNGKTEFLGEIEPVFYKSKKAFSCEPHAVEAEDGTVICHFRVEVPSDIAFTSEMFTIYQAESYDKGKTWTKPHSILDKKGGAPAHLMRHSSGVLISTYGYREAPYGVKVMFSRDNGRSWDTGHDIYINGVCGDLGYPSTVELNDKSMLTVFYAHEELGAPCKIFRQKWSFDFED